MTSLKEMYQEHQGKVSDKWDLYLREYDRLFSLYRDQSVRMLEIGIQNGGSLEIWSKYFPNGEIFVGCDINPDCAKLNYDDPRIVVVVGDANKEESQSHICNLSSSFDLIIDDGSHTSADIVTSFARYFPHLREGGLFVVEDLHCSYWRDFEGGLYYPYSSIGFFKRLADVINHEHWGVLQGRHGVLNGIAKHYSVELTEKVLSTIHSIEFINSMCVVRKQPEAENKLGLRFIAGREESVVTGLHALRQLTLSMNEANNSWSILDEAPEESFEKLTANLVSSTQELSKKTQELIGLKKLLSDRDGQIVGLNQAVVERDALISEIVKSESWRITALFRWGGDQIRRIKSFAKILPGAFNQRVGKRSIFAKALCVYKEEGLEGINNRLIRFRTQGRIKSLIESDGFVRNEYQEWIKRNDTLDDAGRNRILDCIAAFPVKPKITVIMPVYDQNIKFLDEAIWSVRNQLYSEWELCIAIADDATENKAASKLLKCHAKADPRIRLFFSEKNGHISAVSNSALEIATGQFVALFDNDALLAEHALFWVAQTILNKPDADLIYSDEDKVDEDGRRTLPFFKPGWSPHLAISQAYLGHLVCINTSVLKSVGGWRIEKDGAQNYDLWLRVSLQARQVVHIPYVLYHWRMHRNSTTLNTDSKSYAHMAGLLSVRDYLKSRYPFNNIDASDGEELFTYQAKFNLNPEMLVSIIIPTKDRLDLLSSCIDTILNVSSWKNFEILIIDNGSEEAETLNYLENIHDRDSRIKVVTARIPFNWSRLNNIGASHCTGEMFIFLNNDIEVLAKDWIQSLAGYANLPDVATVGGLLLFEDGSIQHCGVVVGMGGWADHVFRLQSPAHDCGGPFVSPALTRNVLAVTGACMAISRDKYNHLGGFDEEFTICGSDVELGLRAHTKGFYNVMCAEAKLIHFESKTRTPHVPVEDFVQSDKKYAPYRVDQIDPFFNPNLSLKSTLPTIEMEPRHDTTAY